MPASSVSFVTLTASTEKQLVGPNTKRKSITFTDSIAAAIVFLRPDPLGNVTGGLAMSGNSTPLTFNVRDHGDIVQGPWFGFSVSAPVVGILETVY